ncbi:phage tail tape measure protein [Streptomyces sp. bgisy091]|uniref:phage tail tape measure protein n=1 Tax=Streptomyces sp. bgisy091 TaxID=3413778 RepID=UPI003D756120
MALTIGELVGFIRLDDGEVRPALRRTEGALSASGQQMATSAQRAGQQAGQALGDSLTRATDGSIRDSRGRFVAEAQRTGTAAGDALGDGLADGAADGAERAGTAVEGGMSRVQMIAGAAGIAAGAILVDAFGQALDQSQITAKLSAQLGTTPAVAAQHGKVAGALFAKGVTADFQTAADTIRAIVKSGLAPPDATNAQLQSIATKASDVASTFGEDLGRVTNAAAQLIRTGLAKNSTEAFDIISKGMSSTADKSEDYLDTLNEYSTQFRRLGLDGQTATGLLSQGLVKGARDADQVADAIGQFGERALAGGTAVDDAFKSIGLNSTTMATEIGKGGASAEAALGKTLERLRGTKDEQVKLNAAAALFGDPANVMGEALFALDPATAAASAGMNKTAGASDALGKKLRSGPAYEVSQMKTRLQQGLVNVIGGSVIPALMKFGSWAQRNGTMVKVFAGIIGGVLVTALTFMAITATQSAAAAIAAWFTTGQTAGASAARQVVAAARVVGAWLLMGVQAMVQGARMAAAWVIAMGPIGWVIAAIVGLGLLIWANWDKIKQWTAQAWDWVWNKIKATGQLLLDFFLNFTLYGLIIKHWDKIRAGTAAAWNWVWGKIKGIGVSIVTTVGGFVANALRRWDGLKRGVATKATALVGYVAGLPGRLARGIGSLTSLLVGKGKDIVRGLWNGIQGMGPWIASKITGWAKSAVPGPIAKALGINSPSKVTAAQGRWTGLGFANGLLDTGTQVKSATGRLASIAQSGLGAGAPALDRTMAGLVTPPTAGGTSSAPAGAYRSAGTQKVQIEIDVHGGDDRLIESIRRGIRVRGKDVQLVLGGRLR